MQLWWPVIICWWLTEGCTGCFLGHLDLLIMLLPCCACVFCARACADWRGSVPEREHQKALLGRGVFHFDGRQLSFASSLAAAYAREQLPHRLPRAVMEQHKQLKRQASLR